MKRLTVSANRRFLMFEDGTPFFWLGDTAWELFHRTTYEEAELYLENRRQKGFTVIQAVALAELDGLNTPNSYGERPLIDNDPLRPNENYFQYMDQVAGLAARKGLFIGLLPTWGDKIELLTHGKGPVIFNPETAFRYGEWIGQRYRDCWNIIWINGGDRAGGGANMPLWNALGDGIKSVDSNHLMTFHPPGGGGGRSSSEWFHNAGWLDFNLAQSGHERKHLRNDKVVDHDYGLMPAKPCLDGEPCYEDHPANWKPAELGWFDHDDARQAAYRAVFSGAFGHTYGCHPIWQFHQPGREPVGFARRPWREALDLPGACQMIHLKRLLLSRPFFSRIPDNSMIIVEPGDREQVIAATRDKRWRYAFVYLPQGGRITLDLKSFGALSFNFWWFNPSDGVAFDAGDRTGRPCVFNAPSSGVGGDWVLVIDAGDMDFPSPGVEATRELLCS